MSAFLAIAYDDRVELLTDGAVYDDVGKLTDIRRKVWAADSLPIAFSGRGTMAAVSAFAALFRLAAIGCTTVDEALEQISSVIDRMDGQPGQQVAEMVICAMSETRGPAIYYFATADVWESGVEPWTLIGVEHELCGGVPVDVSDLDGREGLAGVGAEIFERMRRVPGANPCRPDMPDHYGIGGHVDLTVVSAAGTSVKRLREWPDVVGNRIVPVLNTMRTAQKTRNL